MNLDDTEVWSLCRLGYVLYARERFGEAAAIFHGLVQLRPRSAYPWYALGLVRREQGDFRGAVESLNQAIACDQRFWEARVALAELLRGHGYPQDANAMLEPVTRAAEADHPAVRRGQTLWRCWH